MSVCQSTCANTHMYFASLYPWAYVYPCSYHEPVNKQLYTSKHLYTHLIMLLYNYFLKQKQKTKKHKNNGQIKKSDENSR